MILLSHHCKYKAIDKFVDKLVSYDCPPNVTNQYSASWKNSAVTVSNITQYLKTMISIEPKVLCIGEAPGYNGCRLTGIPFTCEENVVSVYLKDKLFGINNGFLVADANNLTHEISASIVWDTLQKSKFYPLLWNVFPFHPHEAGNENSNRTPTVAELDIGCDFLNDLLSIFSIKQIFCIGRKPEYVFNKNKIPNQNGIPIKYIRHYIRHPSHGGKKMFECTIAELIEHFLKLMSPSNMFVIPKESMGGLAELNDFIQQQ